MSLPPISLEGCANVAEAMSLVWAELSKINGIGIPESETFLWKGRRLTFWTDSNHGDIEEILLATERYADLKTKYDELFEQSIGIKLQPVSVRRNWQQSWRNREGV